MRIQSTQFIIATAVSVAAVIHVGSGAATGQSTSTEPDRVVHLLTGTEQTLSAEYSVGNTAIGNAGVCEIEVLPGRREVLLIARGIGITTLTLWDQRGRKQEEIRIDVSSRELSKLQADLMALLGGYPGVRAEPLGNSIVLNGTVASQEALAAVEGIAKAAGVASVVTLGGSLPLTGAGTAPMPTSLTGPPAAQPAAPQPLLPPGAALPVALTSAAPASRPSSSTPTAPVTMPSGGLLADDDGPPPAAVPNPPPPNVFYVSTSGGSDSLGFGSGLTGASPGPPGPASSSPSLARPTGVVPPEAAGAATGRVDYRIELYEQSALAPPPEVMGPQGTRIFSTTVTAYDGRAARELFVAEQGGRTPDGQTRPMSGISIELTPSLQRGAIATSMTIDTNLPMGTARDAAGPHPWRRAQLDFQIQAGATRYITEQELAGVMSGPGSAPPGVAGGGSGIGGTVAAVGEAAGQAGIAAGIEGAQMVPAIGGLFRLGGGRSSPRTQRDQQPADDRRLVIVVTAVLGSQR